MIYQDRIETSCL